MTDSITVVNQVNTVKVVASPVNLVSVSAVGAQGAAGADGVGLTASVVAGETLSGHKAIAIIGGLAYLADPTNLAHGKAAIGVIRDAIALGQTGTYFTSGEIDGGSFTVDQDYFVGASGALVTTPSINGAQWMKRLGTAKSASVFIVEMDPTILL